MGYGTRRRQPSCTIASSGGVPWKSLSTPEFQRLVNNSTGRLNSNLVVYVLTLRCTPRAWRSWGSRRLCQFLDLHLRVPALEHLSQFGCCPSIACMKTLRSSVGRLLIKLVAKVRRYAIAQQLLHSPYVVRY